MKESFWSKRFVLALSLLCATPDAECQTQSQEVRMTVAELAKRLMDITEIETPENLFVWTPGDSVRIHPDELKEFEEKHVPIARNPERFTPEEIQKNLQTLILHVLTREQEEYDRPEFDPEDIWNTISNSETWKDVGELADSYKGESSYSVVLVPNMHERKGMTSHQKTKIEKVQNEIQEIMEQAYALGARTFGYEGFDRKERDDNIPVRTPLNVTKEKYPSRWMEHSFDRTNQDVQSFGLENVELGRQANVILNTYNILLALTGSERITSVEELTTLFSWIAARNELPEQQIQYLKKIVEELFETKNQEIDSTDLKRLLAHVKQDIQTHVFMERNETATFYIEEIGKNTNSPIIVVKYGGGHFSKKGSPSTIQEYLKKADISYVVIESPTMHQSYPVQ